MFFDIPALVFKPFIGTVCMEQQCAGSPKLAEAKALSCTAELRCEKFIWWVNFYER